MKKEMIPLKYRKEIEELKKEISVKPSSIDHNIIKNTYKVKTRSGGTEKENDTVQYKVNIPRLFAHIAGLNDTDFIARFTLEKDAHDENERVIKVEFVKKKQ